MNETFVKGEGFHVPVLQIRVKVGTVVAVKADVVQTPRLEMAGRRVRAEEQGGK